MRLQSKVFIFFACLFLLLVLQWVFFITYEHRIFTSEMQEKGTLVADNLAEISRDPIINYQFSRLIMQIQSIQQQSDIDHISIVDSRNQVLADTRDAVEGWFFSGPLTEETTVEFLHDTMLVRSPVRMFGSLIGNVEILFSLDAYNQKIRTSTMIFLFFLFFEILISVLFGIFTEFQLVKPLDQLTSQVTNITSQSLDHPIELAAGSVPEITRVAQAIDLMKSNLQQAQQEIVIKTRMATMGKIAANFAHEIRNPLEAISGSVEILSYHIDEALPEFEYLSIIREEIDTLNDYLENFLEFSRQQPVNRRPVDMNSLISSTLLLLRPVYAKKRIHCCSDLSPVLPDLPADAGQIKRVLINIMLNSIEAIDEGSDEAHRQLKVMSRQEADQAVITIEDSGCGIAQEALGQVFEPYFTTKQNGSGIGLAISNQIIERHGGTLGIESAPGMGTTVTVRLPIDTEFTQAEE
jgi:signal transduction histidine kinase